ncbi:O-methyltransferase MdmC-like isoform X1 [Ostrea edulis]|uniref:O-methyltransferase MdmC-like isoform X1 n=1 Tax=Ostrea edulis TaxID=37623 RepID=UPI0024AE8F1B|nr:O-methyltransferase MdmC-like isoform X1 [Ostrea edulis]
MQDYMYDPAYRHLLKAKEIAQKENVIPELQTEINRSIELFQQKINYCDDQTIPPSPALHSLITDTLAYPWSDAYKEGRVSYSVDTAMLSGNSEAQLIKSITSASKARMVLEIGLFTGCASLAMAEALPAEGKVVALELDQGIADVARSFLDKSPAGNKIEIITGPAIESLEKLAEKKTKFDVIFMDANKEGYVPYYKMIFEKDLLASGGTLIVDNVLKNGDTYSGEHSDSKSWAITNFNELVLQDNRVHKVMLPLRDGVYIIRRKEDTDASVPEKKGDLNYIK